MAGYRLTFEFTPQMEDYNNMILNWVPYLMYSSAPNMNFKSVTTDELGFRTSIFGNEKIAPAKYDWSKKSNIIIGGSAAFGVGATSDEKTIPSLLSEKTHSPWVNLGGRAFNSAQELQSFMLFYPQNVENVVLFSGLNNLFISLLVDQMDNFVLPFYHQSVFSSALNDPRSMKVRLKIFVKKLLGRLPKKVEETTSVEDKYKYCIAILGRHLRIWRDLSLSLKLKVSYVFQPTVLFSHKQLSPEETALFEILDSLQSLVSDFMKRQGDSVKERYQQDVEQICHDLKIPFLNLNKDPQFNQGQWLYVDRAHLTDLGNELVAQRIVDLVQRSQ